MAAVGRMQLFKISQNPWVAAAKSMSAGSMSLGDSHKRFASKVKFLPKAHYGGRHTVTMLPGGGIGPELMGYVKEVFR
jgi:isocitrate dehydrogenase (NAD+)